MCGALSVLGVGVVLLDLEGRIKACDQRFAAAVGRPVRDLIGVDASELAHPDDRTRDPWLARGALASGDSFTTLTRRVDRHGPLHENHVVQLFGAATPLLLSISRPSSCRQSWAPVDERMAASVAGYVADMGKQLATMAAEAHMPVTVDLLMAAAAAAEMEGGIGEVEETAA